MDSNLGKKAVIRNTYVDIMFIVGILSIAAVIIFALSTYKTDNTKIEFFGAEKFSTGWVEAKINGDNFTQTNFSNTLPNELDGKNTLCFLSTNEKVNVIIDGKSVYQYGMSDEPSDLNLGSVYNLVTLPNDCGGKTINISFFNSSGSKEVAGHDFMLDNRGNIIFQLFLNNLLSIIICILMGISGLVIFINSLTAMKRNPNFRSEFYLGVFIVSAAIWLATDTLAFQFVFKNKFISYFLSYFSFMFLPYSFLMFAREKFQKYRFPISILAIISWVYFAVRVILYMTNILTFEKQLYFSHLLIVCVIVQISVICIKERKSTEGQNLLASMTLLSFFVALALVSFYANNQQHFNPTYNFYRDFFYIGMILFIGILVYDSYRQNREVRRKAMLSEFYKQSAYNDVLTKVYSRTAFREDFDSANEVIGTYASVTVIMLDLNNLKQINDFYGHSAGDALLCNLANCLKQSFSEVGKVYRIGGDEFVVLIMNNTRDKVDKLIDAFWSNTAFYGSEQLSSKHIAIGVVVRDVTENLDKNIYELFQIADEKMYSDKKEKKLNNIKEAEARLKEEKSKNI